MIQFRLAAAFTRRVDHLNTNAGIFATDINQIHTDKTKMMSPFLLQFISVHLIYICG